MYKIVIKGTAKTEYPRLHELDGIDCQDEFSEYFDKDMGLTNIVTEGYMHFEYNKGDNKLYTVTTYNSTQKLNENQLERLKSYTVGQWSDGIGEGFEQFECHYAKEAYMEDCDDLGVYISPWHRGQIVTVVQFDENGNNVIE